MLLGLTPRELQARFDSILEFAELERFVDQQLKNYSTGMVLRLAYSIAIQVPFDILLLDEVLAVGDESFQAKCFGTFETMRAEGKTIVLVTHDLDYDPALLRPCALPRRRRRSARRRPGRRRRGVSSARDSASRARGVSCLLSVDRCRVRRRRRRLEVPLLGRASARRSRRRIGGDRRPEPQDGRNPSQVLRDPGSSSNRAGTSASPVASWRGWQARVENGSR